ncbi:hypothetical protein [Streptomyces sp. NPDC051286]|uniref:hypothetical protein n=1 Tax=Streptomyces sp. NPDC051286 TaxID=3365647 RepID=UPI0037B3C7EB
MTGGAFDPADRDFATALTALDTQATGWWGKLDTSTGRKALWADLSPATDSGMFGQSYTRLRTVATAWATPGTSLTGDTAVRDGLLDALRFLNTVGYNPSRGESGNWWFWEIGAPRALMDTCESVVPRPNCTLVDHGGTPPGPLPLSASVAHDRGADREKEQGPPASPPHSPKPPLNRGSVKLLLEH